MSEGAGGDRDAASSTEEISEEGWLAMRGRLSGDNENAIRQRASSTVCRDHGNANYGGPFRLP